MSYDGHDGTDFAIRDERAMAAGVAVVASADGVVRAVRDGMPDITVEAGGRAAIKNQECGNGVAITHADGYETQYCHMRQGSIAVRPGDRVRAGDRLGLVGLSGLTSFPHIHLTVREDGQKLDPFDGGPPTLACGTDGVSLWRPDVTAQLPYHPFALTKIGVASRQVGSDEVWSGQAGETSIRTDADALIVFVGGFYLRRGDLISLRILDPAGNAVVEGDVVQDRAQARSMRFVGKRRPAEGWQPGNWTARVTVTRGKEVQTLATAFSVVQ
jgi:hypothetical protein